MMKEMNEIRNSANAYHLVYTESDKNTSDFEYVERFELDWSLYKGKKLSEDAIGQFHL